MKENDKTAALHRLAEQAIPDDTNLWPAIGAQIQTAAPRRAWQPGAGGRRRLLIGVTAAVVLALIIGATSPLWNPAAPASAQAILDQAQASAGSPVAVRTYHLQMTHHAFVKGNATITTEIWFGGSGLQRSSDRMQDGSGALLSSGDAVFNGAQAWIAITDEGQTRVVHTTGTAWKEPALDPSRQATLAGVLAQYSNDKSCMDARLQGEGSAAGQAAYVIAVTPKPASCDGRDKKADAAEADHKSDQARDKAKAAAAQADASADQARADAKAAAAQTDPEPGQARANAKATAAAGKEATATDEFSQMKEARAADEFGQMLVWVDKVTFLPLKSEVRGASGALLESSEVTNIEYNVDIPGSVFTYTAPAGAQVFELTGGDGADAKMTLLGDSGANDKVPAKKP